MNKVIGMLAGAGLFAAAQPCAAQATNPNTTQAPVLPASREAVFISKAQIDRTAAARKGAGTALGVLGAARAGDDRVNVDVLYRDDPKGEGPVTHDVVTEVYYILDGGGEFETGGRIEGLEPMLTNGQPTNPANIGPSKRGTTITGGALHKVGAGDVIIIPPNTPHRFRTLSPTVTYIVVRHNPDYERGR